MGEGRSAFDGLQLLIGPPNEARSLSECEAVWHDFKSLFPSLIPLTPTFQAYGANEVPAVAVSRVLIGPRYRTTSHVWIILGDRFFAASIDHQRLTLLHEAIHIHLNLGPLRDRAIESIEVERTHKSDERDWFKYQRLDLACKFRSFADEVLAEQYLQRRHSDFGPARVRYYRELREQFAGSGQLETLPSDLRCWGFLYEMVRNDLGCSIAREGDDLKAFQWLRTRFLDRLKSECADVAARLLALRDRLLAVDLDREPHDFAPCDEAFNLIMELEENVK